MLRKLFTSTVVILTIFWAVGLAAFVPTAQAISSGDLIKQAAHSAVYYYGEDGKRYVFPSEKTYQSWYGNDFSAVITISATELASITIGGNVTYRPGVKLIKIISDPTVYAVDANGTLRAITSEAVASALYGSNWASMVEDLADSFFTNYTVGAPINDAADFNPSAATSAATSINVDKGIGSGSSGGVGGALNISLASDSPTSRSVPGGNNAPASNVVFAKINLSAGASAVTVDKVTITRTGLSSDGDLAAVKIWDGAEQLDTAQTLNSSHQVKFNINKTIAANSTLVLTVTGDLAVGSGTASAEIRLGIASNSDVTSNASSVAGAPAWGNQMTAVSTDVGSLTVAQGGSMPAIGSTVDLNQTETFFAVKLTAGSIEDVTIKAITFQSGNNSSINEGDLEEIKLINDTTGETIATLSSLSANGDAIFDLSANPIKLAKGNTRDFVISATVIDGSGRNIAFDISDGVSYLIDATGDVYGFGVSMPLLGNWNGIGVATAVNQGTVTVSKASTSPSAGNIPIGGTDVDIAEYAFDLQGEDARFGTTVVNIAVNDTVPGLIPAGTPACSTIIDNVKLVNADTGEILAGPVTPVISVGLGLVTGANNICVATFTSSYELANGANTIQVLVNTTANMPAGEVVTATIPTVSFANVRGLTSNRAITPAPAATNIVASAQTVQGPALLVEMGATPIQGNVVRGVSGKWIAYVGLDASGGGEDVRVQSMALTNALVAAGAQNVAVETAWINAKLIDIDTLTQVGNTVQPAANVLNFTFSGDELVVGQSNQRNLALVIDVLSTATATWEFNFDVTALSGTGKASATVASINGTTSALFAAGGGTGVPSPEQVVTVSGSLIVDLDADTATSSQLVSSSSGNSVATYTFEAVDENVDVKDIFVVAANPTALGAVPATFGSDVLSLEVYADGVKVGSTLSASATGIHQLSLSTPLVIIQDEETVLEIKVALHAKANVTSGTRVVLGIADGGAVNTNPPLTGALLGTTWGGGVRKYDINATGQDSGAILQNINSTGTAAGLIYGGNQMSVHDGVLTVTLNSSSPSGLKVANTSQELMRINLTAAGDKITVTGIGARVSTTCTTIGGAAANSELRSVDNSIVYDTAADAAIAPGAPSAATLLGFVPTTALEISTGTTKTIKLVADTTGCGNPFTIQASLVGGVSAGATVTTANGVIWNATDGIAIGAAGWAGPATKELPLDGGAISY